MRFVLKDSVKMRRLKYSGVFVIDSSLQSGWKALSSVIELVTVRDERGVSADLSCDSKVLEKRHV